MTWTYPLPAVPQRIPLSDDAQKAWQCTNEIAVREFQDPRLPWQVQMRRYLLQMAPPPTPAQWQITFADIAIISPPQYGQLLQTSKEAAYTPLRLQFGPYWRSNPTLNFDDFKLGCVNVFLHSCGKSLDELIWTCIGVDPHVRFSDISRYQPAISTTALQFILLLDSVFILSLLVFTYVSTAAFHADPNKARVNLGSLMRNYPYRFYESIFVQFFKVVDFKTTVHDLHLVGNQVPLIYLIKLSEQIEFEKAIFPLALFFFALSTSPFDFSEEAKELVLKHGLVRGVAGSASEPKINSMLTARNLIECVYIASCYTVEKDTELAAGIQATTDQLRHLVLKSPISIPSATRLSQVGIFVKAAQGGKGADAVRYKKATSPFGHGVIEVPELSLDAWSESSLKCLLVFESSSPPTQPTDDHSRLVSYASLIDSLIQEPEDVQLLCEAGVLENHLGSNERLEKVWEAILPGGSGSFNDETIRMAQEITTDYTNRWRGMFYEFYSLFLSKPWLVLSTIAAVGLLVMTAMQTAYTAFGYYKVNP